MEPAKAYLAEVDAAVRAEGGGCLRPQTSLGTMLFAAVASD